MKYKQNLHIDGNRVISYTTHVATIDHAARRLLVHGWWSVTTSKHINYVAKEYGLTKVDAPRDDKSQEDDGSGMLKTVAMVAALGQVFCSGEKEQNDWKLRMMKAGLTNQGLSVPDNFDSLPESERTRRLDAALAAIA